MASGDSGTAKPTPTAVGAFMKPLHPSKELAAIVGAEPLARSEAVSRMWAYIKEHKLYGSK